MKFQVQGYAIPWNRSGFAELGEETAAPTSISPPRPEGANVTLIFGTHETERQPVLSQTRKRTLSFFSDAYGLGFSAWLDDDFASHRGVRTALANGTVTQCSVNLVGPRFVTDEDQRARLIYARIDHVALVWAGAYPDTGCWLADQPYRDRAPWLLDMSFTYGRTLIERARVSGHSPSNVGRDTGRAPASSARGGAGRGASPRPSLRSCAGAIMARIHQLGLPCNGVPMGIAPAYLLAKLDQMAKERGL